MHFDELVGSEFLDRSDGTATVRLTLREEHHGVHGFVHGGVVCTLAHQSAGSAVYSLCRDGREAVMIEMKVNFVRARGRARSSRSEVVRMGSRTALWETRVSGTTASSGRRGPAPSWSFRASDLPQGQALSGTAFAY